MLKPRPTYLTWRFHWESAVGEKCHEKGLQYFENCRS